MAGVKTWRAVAAAAVCLGLGGAALGAPGDVVISQIYGGVSSATGTAGSPRADFVELFNRTGSPVSLNGWSLAIATPTGNWTQENLPSVSIPAYSYFLVRTSATATNGTDVSADHVMGTLSFTTLTTTGARVLLRDVTTPALGGTATCPTGVNVIDVVGIGSTASCREGSASAPSHSTTNATTRLADGCVDTNANGADFVSATAGPRNLASGTIGGCAVGSCCNLSTGACTPSLASGCTASGFNFVAGTACSASPCPATGACCSPSATCSILTQSGCAAIFGVYQNNGTTCTAGLCGSTTSCCFGNGTCCNIISGSCTLQGGTPGGATCTTAGNCTQAPANDNCSGAVALTLGSPVTGNNSSATSSDGLNTRCSTLAATRGVWYTFTPGSTGLYDITTCGSLFDTVLGVFTIGSCTDLSTWNHVACDDDLCPTGTASTCGTTSSASAGLIDDVQLSAGTVYYIRVSSDGATVGTAGNFVLQVTAQAAAAVGACCNDFTGACEIRTQASCTASDPGAPTFQGAGSTCESAPCNLATGACCYTGGVCVLQTGSRCLAVTTATYLGDNEACFPEPRCIIGACCTQTGTCTVTTQTACLATSTNTYVGNDTTCTTPGCPPAGTCCNACTLACVIRTQAFCSDVWVQGQTCTTGVCAVGAAPANDGPCGAVVASINGVYSQLNGTATGTGDGPQSSCDGTAGKGVWYSFTPGSTGYYAVSTCGSTFASVVTVLTGDCANPDGMAVVACDDDTCVGGAGEPAPCGGGNGNTAAAVISFVRLTAPQLYYARVQADGTGVGGTLQFTVTPVSAGACCNVNTGVCTVALATGCVSATSDYRGDNTVCDPSPCAATGACCNNATGVCTSTTMVGCASGSTYGGDGGGCNPIPCPPQANLAIAVTTAVACGQAPGQPLQTVYTVSNISTGTTNAAAQASGVVATVHLPANFAFTGSTPSGSFSAGTLTVNLGSIALGASTTLTVNGTATGSGSGDVMASVAGSDPDPSSTNNSVTQRVFVRPGSPSPIQVVLSDLAPRNAVPVPGFPGATVNAVDEAVSRVFGSPNGQRWIVSVDTTNGRALVVGNSSAATWQVVATTGITQVSAGETLASLDYGMGVNDSGEFVFSGTTSAASGNVVVVKGSLANPGVFTVVARQGAAVPALGAGFTYAGENWAYAVRNNGNVLFHSFVAGPGITNDNDAFVFDGSGNSVLAQENVTFPANVADTYRTSTAANTTPFGQYTSGELGLGVQASGASGYSLSGFLNGGTAVDDVIVVGGNAVVRAGDVPPGFSDAVTTINYSNITGAGAWLGYGQTGGSALDWAIRDGVVLARTDDPVSAGATELFDDAPYAQTFFGFAANSAGDYAVAGTTNSADALRNAVIVANNSRIVAAENDPIDVNGNGAFDDDAYINVFRDDRMFLSPDGWLYFTVTLRRANGTGGICSTASPTVQGRALLRVNINPSVCCRGSTCDTTAAGACTVVAGSQAGAASVNATACNASGANNAPCCKADYNKMNNVELLDIFAFLNDWFAGRPYADFNGQNNVDLLDIFAFLTAWFSGPC